MKILLIIPLLFLILNARENPFLPIEGQRDIPITSNKVNIKPPLKRVTIALPKYARILQKVTIEYKNLDGSLEKKSIELDNTIDWHLPIFISQSFSEKPKKQKIKKVQKFEKIASMEYASFYTLDKKFKIITKDRVLRDFLLVSPHRIVIDFDRDISLEGFTEINENNIFTKLRVGNHNRYYRVVIELDGYYRYTKKKIPNGYIFQLR